METAPLATRLRIHLYTICWNEAAMLGFFFRHYDPWIARYVVYDDGSTDGTLEALARHPRVEVRRFPRTVADSFVMSATVLQDRMWKESRGAADWVVITAMDEHLHHPALIPWLEASHDAGITLAPALGYQMVADEVPPEGMQLATGLTRGAPWPKMAKLSLFRPDALEETRFRTGRHAARPTGRLVYPARDELLLLHYKFLGAAYTKARHRLLATGLGAQDRANNWGVHYLAGDAAVEEELARYKAMAVDLADPGHLPDRDYPRRRWWREAR
jgi:hypothetical protein